jgi:uroporphyrin-III C-methyltransferase
MIYLIGSGPGDPSLITKKALDVIQSADVILYDYLVHPTIILHSDFAKKICVGKKKGAHSKTQLEINNLLIHYFKQGKVVARLKGGDPMIFGRCAEEMMALNREGIPFEVIPGITSAIAVPTYAGIPITHREISHSVAFVTATRANDLQNMAFSKGRYTRNYDVTITG